MNRTGSIPNQNTAIIFTVMLLLMVALFQPLAVSGANKKPHQVVATKSKIRVDARLDEPLWQEALTLELKNEFFPGENIKPPVRTQVYLAHSDNYLYVAFRAFDPEPRNIRACVTDRDKYGGDDWVGIMLDTFNDERRTYNFYCNPLGIQGDDIESPEGGGLEWDAIWNSAGRITDQGFIVEMAIPFSSLRFPKRHGKQVWGIDAIRCYPRSVKHFINLFPRDRNNNCLMCQADKIIGFEHVSPGKNIELAPTLTTVFTQERENRMQGKFIEKDSQLSPGLTARWGITPNMTLSATLNPDFSNVEADIPKLEINTQFAIYYKEKRPFFLEGSSIFTTRFQAVHTRSLAEPDWGVKLTGKEGRHTVGFFTVQDSLTNLLIPGNQGSRSTSVAMKSVGSVLRYRFDLGKSSTLGVLVTDREGDDYFNRMGGIDGDIRITPKDRLRFQFLGSQTRYPDQIATKYHQEESDFWGSALDIYYHHDTRSLDWHVAYKDVHQDFRADLGFMPQAGYRNYDAGLAYTWQRRRGSWFTKIDAGASYQLEKDRDNQLLYKAAVLTLDYEGPLQSFINLSANIGKRTYLGTEFDDTKLYYTLGLQLTGNLQLVCNGLLGRQIDYTNLQEGDRFQLEGFIYYRPGRHLSILLDHTYERLDVDAGRLYTANVSYMRLIYQFNRRFFLRTMLQYVDYKYNTENYSIPVDPREKHLFSQILLSYKLNPRTVMFLGYSDDYYGFHQIPLTQTNRTFFFKIGYALGL